MYVNKSLWFIDKIYGYPEHNIKTKESRQNICGSTNNKSWLIQINNNDTLHASLTSYK